MPNDMLLYTIDDNNTIRRTDDVVIVVVVEDIYIYIIYSIH